MAATAAPLGVGDDALFAAAALLDGLALPPRAPGALVQAAACLWVASKYSAGARAPPASAVAAALPPCGCGACAGCRAPAGAAAAAARRRLLRAEGDVLRALDYGARLLRRPTAEAFLRPALLRLRARDARQPHRHQHPWSRFAAPLSALLAEQALLESQLLGFRPSVVAAACVAFAHVLLGAPLTAAELADLTGVDCGCGGAEKSGAAAADGGNARSVSAAVGLLRAVHAAVSAAAAAGNPYACSMRWAAREPAVVRVPPIDAAADARLAPLAAAAAARAAAKGAAAAAAGAPGGAAAAGAWEWVLP